MPALLVADNLVHLGYALMLAALLARDVLWLRSMLVAAQGTLAAYAWLTGRPSMAAWNALFVLINLIWSVRIYRSRRSVALPAALAPIHAAHFAALSALEFLTLWGSAKTRSWADGASLVTQGQRPEALHYLLSGTVQVQQAGVVLSQLQPGAFVGEMSLLTGTAANADARCQGAVETRSWPAQGLDRIQARNPALWSRIQSVLGRDLVEKIQRAARPQQG